MPDRPPAATTRQGSIAYALSEEDALRLTMLFTAMDTVQTLCSANNGYEIDFDHHAAGPLFWHFADVGRRIVEACDVIRLEEE